MVSINTESRRMWTIFCSFYIVEQQCFLIFALSISFTARSLGGFFQPMCVCVCVSKCELGAHKVRERSAVSCSFVQAPP